MRTAGVGNAEWDVKWTEEFQRYWSSRKDRTYCAGWFDIQLLRASEVSTHPIDERLPLVREVRARIDRLPPRDRAMTLLWFCSTWDGGDSLASLLVTTPELVEILHKLDPADLRGVLARKFPTDDPDLPSRFDRMCLFILNHARELLRPEDADFLLECERQERGRKRQNAGLESSSWTTAANELKSRRSPH